MSTHSSIRIRIGTRSSPLALAQGELVRSALLADDKTLDPAEVVLQPMVTAGDVETVKNLAEWGFKGLFTKELEEALLSKRIDCAVHSMKDVPSELQAGLVIAAMLERADTSDAFISHTCEQFDALPQGAVIGTSSIRRSAQIRHLRPDVQIVPLRGNVQTRLKKLEQGAAHATFLASAGLKRLGLNMHIKETMDSQRMLPAIAQGAIGVECTSANDALLERLARISHSSTMLTVSAEREVLKMVDGSCRTPIAGYCHYDGNYIHLDAMVIAPDGSEIIRQTIYGPKRDALYLGAELGSYLKERGSAYLS